MDNYKVRFKEEFYQIATRRVKLRAIIEKHDAGTLDFELDCPIRLLRYQLNIMDEYYNILRERAVIEKIELE